MQIVEATQDHLDHWLNLRQQLWPEPDGLHLQEMAEILDSGVMTAFLLYDDDAFDDSKDAIGFIEGSLYLGDSQKYGYVEGWYVASDFRGQGWGGRLLAALEQWILHQSITLVLSDTIPKEYPLRTKAHHQNGYEDLITIQVFVKRSDSSSITAN